MCGLHPAVVVGAEVKMTLLEILLVVIVIGFVCDLVKHF
jgi:hypothetical protein